MRVIFPKKFFSCSTQDGQLANLYHTWITLQNSSSEARRRISLLAICWCLANLLIVFTVVTWVAFLARRSLCRKDASMHKTAWEIIPDFIALDGAGWCRRRCTQDATSSRCQHAGAFPWHLVCHEINCLGSWRAACRSHTPSLCSVAVPWSGRTYFAELQVHLSCSYCANWCFVSKGCSITLGQVFSTCHWDEPCRLGAGGCGGQGENLVQ